LKFSVIEVTLTWETTGATENQENESLPHVGSFFESLGKYYVLRNQGSIALPPVCTFTSFL
jgi:hypothetical protein